MIEVIDVEGANVIGVRVQGKIQKDEMLKALDTVKDALDDMETVNIYAEVDEFEGFEVQAFLHDMRVALPNALRFRKEAVVTNQESLKKWIYFSNLIWLGGQAKVFSTDNRDAAIEWVQHPA
ncbi:Uncharacterised protein [BD1-7 clade bacterium]|uniref:STAS/SEC14 domain-containing protein n=1 Tax=BD1-7 clade bacterium TaxID=2029982 RepID=A0A5S9QWJ9_9GAMM|nr:Uncharacterised protein [BD1-7 clade bacterium]